MINVAFAWQRSALLAHHVLASVMGSLILFTWNFVQVINRHANDGEDLMIPIPMMPEGSQGIEIAAIALSALFVGAGFIRAWLAKPNSGYWSGIGVTVALLSLIIVFLRVNGLEHSMSWAMVGGVSALLFLVAATMLKSHIAGDLQNPALAAYAVGVLAAFGLGLSMTLERAWLTVGLALILPAMGWVYARLPVPVLRKVALVGALIVIVRLMFNQFIFDYDIEGPLLFNWTLYGYGLPALAFYGASRFFRRDKRDGLVNVLEAGALVFAAVCLSLQVRIHIHDGDLTNWSYLLSEAAVNTILWITFAYGLFRRAATGDNPVAIIGARVFAGLAIAHIVLIHVLILNPYWSGEAVGTWPIFNILFLAYAVPAALFCLFYLPWHRERLGQIFAFKDHHGEALLSISAFILGFVYITLEVTRSYHGSRLDVGATGDAELYTYSLVWLVYAAILMGVGIWRQIPALRMASLTVIALVSLKVFLFDMANLAGLLRVFSFLGLALSFFGIAYLYQRFVIPKENPGALQNENSAAED